VPIENSPASIAATLSQGGIIGLLTLAVAVVLLIVGIGLLAGRRSRVVAAVYLLLATAPLLLGLTGTWLGYRSVERVVTGAPVEIGPEAVEDGRRVARITTWIGLVGSLPCLGIGLVALALGPRDETAS
jgi:hypothetical protein